MGRYSSILCIAAEFVTKNSKRISAETHENVPSFLALRIIRFPEHIGKSSQEQEILFPNWDFSTRR